MTRRRIPSEAGKLVLGPEEAELLGNPSRHLLLLTGDSEPLVTDAPLTRFLSPAAKHLMSLALVQTSPPHRTLLDLFSVGDTVLGVPNTIGTWLFTLASTTMGTSPGDGVGGRPHCMPHSRYMVGLGSLS